MSDLNIWIGNIGADGVWYLRDNSAGFSPIDISLLPGPQPTFKTINAVTASYTGPWDSTLLYGSRVLADTSGSWTTLDVIKLWNDVKNMQVKSSTAEQIYFDGIVHVDVQVGTDSFDASHLILNGVKRANVITGNGDDVVEVAMVTNLGAWQDDYRIFTGAGDDLIVYRGLDILGELAAGDMTYLKSATDNRGLYSDGALEISWTDAGDGNDRVIGYNSLDNIIGGHDTGAFNFVTTNAPPSGFAYSVGGAAKGGHVSTLYKIELATGVTTAVGAVSIAGAPGKSGDNLDVEALSFNPKDGFLYGVVNTPGKLQGLIKIDPTTAQTTFIGGNVSKYASSLQDAAFDLSGSLYLADRGALVKVSTIDGSVTVVNANSLSKKIGALAINPLDGKMYGLAEEGSKTVLYSIEKTTGQVTASLVLSGVAKNSDIEGMSFDSAGHLWGIDRISGAIVSIDVANGSVSAASTSLAVSKQTGDGFESLAIRIDADKIVTGIDTYLGDVLSGAGGQDNFIYRAGDGVDTITDFVKGADHLSISGYTAAQTKILTYGSDSFVLFNDNSADGYVDQAMIKFTGVTGLSTGDFFFS